MTRPDQYILVVDDAGINDEYLTDAAASEYEIHFARTIQEAYWKYVENPQSYKLVLLDFNLQGNYSRSNFDGIDLALIIDTFAGQNGLETPWIVAFTAAEDEMLECFFSLSLKAPLFDVVRKGRDDNILIHDQLRSLFSALSAGDPGKFQTSYRKRAQPVKQEIRFDEKALAICDIYKNKGKEYFSKLADKISKALFRSYRNLEFSALAPGFSGSEVLSVVAQRSRYDEANARTFVIKLCRDKTTANEKLAVEVKNYFDYAGGIKEHVPLLIGPFHIKDWQFIAYDFVFVEGRGVTTFADSLSFAIERREFTESPEVFEELFSSANSEFIFEKILKSWHTSRGVSVETSDTYFFYFKDKNWFEPILKAAKEKIISENRELESALKNNDPRLNMDWLGLNPGGLTLSNPLYVVDRLLNDNAYKHFLSGGVVHGDLHSGNILRSLNLYAGDPGAWMLIDFANVIGAAHLAQDGTRLECDIKFQKITSTPTPRFALEVELARWLDLFLANKLETTLNMPYWAKQWKASPKNHNLIQCQIQDIRKSTLKRLKESSSNPLYSPYLDYTVALLMQSLMFIRYSKNSMKTLHCWLAACLAATLIEQYFAAKTDEEIIHDIGLR